MQAAATIHLHRFIIRTNHPKFKVFALVDAYNAANYPAALRTAREHRAFRRFSRQIWRTLSRPEYAGAWHDTDDGKLIARS
jgi:hypothetical protein